MTTDDCPHGCRNGWVDSRADRPTRCPDTAHHRPRTLGVARAIADARANARPTPPPDDAA